VLGGGVWGGGEWGGGGGGRGGGTLKKHCSSRSNLHTAWGRARQQNQSTIYAGQSALLKVRYTTTSKRHTRDVRC
jgi:hypothetical protein